MTARLIINADPDAAIALFKGAAQDLENRTNWSREPDELRNLHHQWIENQYPPTRQHLGLLEAEKLLHGRFYWHSVDIDISDGAAAGRLHQGMRREAARLRDLATEI